MNEKQDPIDNLIFGPAAAANYTVSAVTDRYNNRDRGARLGISSMDMYLHRIMPGELTVILANTSQYKTGFMQHWARVVAMDLADKQYQEGKPREVVVYVSWENLAEQLGYYDIMANSDIAGKNVWYGECDDDDIQKFIAAASERRNVPLWIIARSLGKRTEQIQMTLETVHQALLRIEYKWNIKPALIFLDYLQEINGPDRVTDMRDRVMQNIARAKDIALSIGCPIVVAAQAGRQVLDQDDKVPTISAAQESSRIEQSADKIIALWYPCKTEKTKRIVLNGLGQLPVDKHLLIARILKNRFGPSGQTFPLRVEPERNLITPMMIESTVMDY